MKPVNLKSGLELSWVADSVQVSHPPRFTRAIVTQSSFQPRPSYSEFDKYQYLDLDLTGTVPHEYLSSVFECEYVGCYGMLFFLFFLLQFLVVFSYARWH